MNKTRKGKFVLSFIKSYQYCGGFKDSHLILQL